jgi:hypothetical protein
MRFAPLAAPLCNVLLGFALGFVQELGACGVSQQVKPLMACTEVHLSDQALLPAARSAVTGGYPRREPYAVAITSSPRPVA